ncbi:MAG: hypothetical protein ACOCXA_07480 [Planctomycetota bacterium]
MHPTGDLSARFQAIGVRLRTNRNRRTLVSLRDQRSGPPVLSVHEDLLRGGDPAVVDDLLRFAHDRGGGSYPAMQLAMQEVVTDPPRRHALRFEALRDLPPIGPGFDFETCFRAIHARYFPQLSRPFFRWSRNPGTRRLRSMRFGTYVRRPHPAVRLCPRLAQPWIARVFVEHVLHHELCHHAQASSPRPGEMPHSERFRAWERGFPHLDLALAWEAAHLKQLLAPPQDRIRSGLSAE